MPELVSKRKIMRACKSHGWMVQSTALEKMYQYLNEMDKDYLGDVLSELSQSIDTKTTLITESIWNQVIESNRTVVSSNAQEEFEMVNAFETPRLSYDTMRKAFSVEEKNWPLLGSVSDKVSSFWNVETDIIFSI
jgi:hypothetical protein